MVTVTKDNMKSVLSLLDNWGVEECMKGNETKNNYNCIITKEDLVKEYERSYNKVVVESCGTRSFFENIDESLRTYFDTAVAYLCASELWKVKNVETDESEEESPSPPRRGSELKSVANKNIYTLKNYGEIYAF